MYRPQYTMNPTDAAPAPPRMGTKWLATEDAELLEQLQRRESMAEIARKHERTEKAIEIRAAMLAARMVESGKTPEEASEVTGVPVGAIQEQLSKGGQRTTPSPLGGVTKLSEKPGRRASGAPSTAEWGEIRTALAAISTALLDIRDILRQTAQANSNA